MPWVRAILRGQKIYAQADADGKLAVKSGRVEIRYKPNDGRRYEARADNLEVVDAKPLPDDTCSPAEAVASENAKAGATAGAAKAPRTTKAQAAKAHSTASVPEGSVLVYADGACSGNPGPAGLGVVVIDGAKRVELSEYLGVATNNIAELTAVLRALDEIDAARPTVIYTDSQYTIGVVQKGWKAKANTELVAELREAISDREDTRLAYVPGHSGVLLNERADALAREAVTERKTRRQVYEPKVG